MRLQDIGPAIIKRLWMVIALLLVSALAAAIVAQVQSPVYKVEIAISATAPINRTTGLPDAMTQGAYVALTPSISNFAESVQVAERVSRRLANQGIDLSPEELVKKVGAMPEANSTSVKITFTDRSPTRVTDIANTWGETMELMTLKSEANEYYDESFKNLLLNGNIVLTNRAVVPQKPTQPKPMAYLGLGVFVGLVLGLVLVVLIEYFDPHFRSTREAEESLGLPVLGVLPKVKGAGPGDLLPDFGEGSLTWEAYAELRSGVMLSHREDHASLVVAPAVPFPAAPAVAANLAASIANTGRKTLLVDADLRERALSRLLGAEGRAGLHEALEKGEDPRTKMVETGIANLFFLPAGARTERSTDLLSSPAFTEELREQEEVFDQVVVCAPSLQGSVDAAVLSSAAGNFLAVIDAERCTRKAAEEALRNVERVGIEPMGVALVNVKVKERGRAGAGTEKESGAEAARKSGKAGKAATAAAPPSARPAPPRTPRREMSAAVEMHASGVKAAPEAPPTPKKEARRGRVAVAPAPEPAPEPTAPSAKGAAAAHAGGTAAGTVSYGTPERTAAESGGEETPPAARRTWRPVARDRAASEGKEALRPAPERTIPAAGGEEARARERVMEEFRRKGERGEPIPKTWLRGLTSDKQDVRESATAAITAYYHAFLHRYAIGEENVREITETIIRMMRREGEFASMGEAEAQDHLRRMLAEAGARLAGKPTGEGVEAAGEQAAGAAAAAENVPAAPELVAPAADRAGSEGGDVKSAAPPEEFRLPEKKRFRLAPGAGAGKLARRGRNRGARSSGEGEEGVDWE
ncbi:MAG: hypothetical protein QME88_07565 [Actinomycetota bacterium]|nr:hypothetical protein [Actinomycetota bacterium]